MVPWSPPFVTTNHCCATGLLSKTCTTTDIQSWFVHAYGYLSSCWANLFNVLPQFFSIESYNLPESLSYSGFAALALVQAQLLIINN